MSEKAWDFWAERYDRLWVQKYSLGPTRQYVLEELARLLEGNRSGGGKALLDLGCGPGELLWEIAGQYPDLTLTGIDFSESMLKVSRRRNPFLRHLLLDAMDIAGLDETFDLITCTHSLPYYAKAQSVLHNLAGLLAPAGKLIIAFASGNSLYDRVILSGVKLSTGGANYPSDQAFRAMVKDDFSVDKVKIIKRAVYMPRIAVYTLSLKKAGEGA